MSSHHFSSLSSPLYANVMKRVEMARQTGTNTRVSLIQQRICFPQRLNICPPLYHVGLMCVDVNSGYEQIFEHGPMEYDDSRDILESNTVILPLPSIEYTLADIQNYEETLTKTYFLGIRDCRHHTEDLLVFMYDL